MSDELERMAREATSELPMCWKVCGGFRQPERYAVLLVILTRVRNAALDEAAGVVKTFDEEAPDDPPDGMCWPQDIIADRILALKEPT